jgi:hypothetical protein
MFRCSITGETADPSYREDELGPFPDGWVRITLERRVLNLAHQRVRAAMAQDRAETEAALVQAGLVDEALTDRMLLADISIEARYHSLLLEHPEYVVASETAVLGDPDENLYVLEGLNAARAAMGQAPFRIPKKPADE